MKKKIKYNNVVNIGKSREKTTLANEEIDYLKQLLTERTKLGIFLTLGEVAEKFNKKFNKELIENHISI